MWLLGLVEGPSLRLSLGAGFTIQTASGYLGMNGEGQIVQKAGKVEMWEADRARSGPSIQPGCARSLGNSDRSLLEFFQ